MRRALLVPAAVLLAGCLPQEQPTLLFDERFEVMPAPPRWSVVGELELVPTFHPAEHGLRFVTAAELTTPLGFTVWDEYSDGQWIEYSTSCGAPPTTWLEGQPDGSWWFAIELPPQGDGRPGEVDRIHASFPPVPRAEWSGSRVTGLKVVAPAGGPCVIDNLRLYQPANPRNW
jgi:hypothetical protein